MDYTLSIVIPSYNGAHLLEHLLPSLYAAIRRSGYSVQILVSDDGSSDSTVTQLAHNHPSVMCIASPNNTGFSAACNRGVAEAQAPLIVLLNNDMTVDPLLLIDIAKPFADCSLFGLRLDIINQPIEPYVNRALLRHSVRLRRGLLETPLLELDAHTASAFNGPSWVCADLAPHALTASLPAVATLSGGAAIFSREKFQKIGGFSDFFSPFYWEDTDLSLRAWSMGWWIAYDSTRRVFHKTHSTIASFNPRKVALISYRNRFRLAAHVLPSKTLATRVLPFALLRASMLLVHGDLGSLQAMANGLTPLKAPRNKAALLRCAEIISAFSALSAAGHPPTTYSAG